MVSRGSETRGPTWIRQRQLLLNGRALMQRSNTMETTDERRADLGAPVGETLIERTRVRRELSGLQAQLIALAATVGVVTMLVLIFVLLTGTL